VSTLAPMSEATERWFRESFAEPTRVQAAGWATIATRAHTLMLAPTGSGKTLAAFLWCIDRLTRSTEENADARGYRVLYISPIKALAYDVERNLRAPLIGIGRVAARDGLPHRPLRVDVRTGDTPTRDRERQRKDPGDILITTPESLYLMLGSRAAATMAHVDTVIVDEIHAVAATKRGVHLALSLERLTAQLAEAGVADPQRIGLSATQRPLSEIARYLGGDRKVEIVDAGEVPRLDLEIVVPVPDMNAPHQPEAGTAREAWAKRGKKVGAMRVDPHAYGALEPAKTSTVDLPAHGLAADERGLWPAIHPRLLDLILAHRSTILFVNSRRLAERLAQQLSELAIQRGVTATGEELVRAHHGSVSRHQRLEIEEALKAGRLRAIAATSSLELGIDMGAVELVIQVESPGSVARGLQRIGRAGHQVGGTSRGRIVPKFRGDLLEATVVVRKMLDGEVESTRLPENCLDVLAQQIVAMCADRAWTIDALEAVIKRAASYRDLTRAALTGVLDMLAGRYPSDEFAELRPRLTWDRAADTLVGRRGARLLSVVSGGTIPDRGTYPVHLGERGPRVGELDEEMVHESRKGETFLLGATTWRIEDITRDRVVVSPAPGEPGKMPFWRGEGPGRPIELGRSVGAFVRDLDARLMTGDPAAAVAWLADRHRLDGHAAGNLIAHVAEQRASTGTVPTDRAFTVERFRDELGDVRVCILSALGAQIHAPWALVLSRRLEDRLGYPVHPLYTDDGIALRFADGDDIPDDDALFPDPDDIDDALVAELSRSSVFAARFRENAARALLLPRRRPGQRTPLWQQRLKAQQLLGVAVRYPAFPITLETYRECLRDAFDVPGLIDVMRQVRSREIRVEGVTTDTASPFARSLVFDYVAAFLYEGDAPLAERKAQALTLDRTLLRELLGGGELRDLLDPEVLDEVEAELQLRAPPGGGDPVGSADAAGGFARGIDRRARSADELHDVLRRVGDLDEAELAARATDDLAIAGAVRELEASRRAVQVRIAGTARWIAAEDAARYRDALGVMLPPGIPQSLLELTAEPVVSLIQRWARTHAPFTTAEVAARWGLPEAHVATACALLEERGQLTRGALRPAGAGAELCDPEVLRMLRRRTLARLRREVSPLDRTAFARFLPRWHGVATGRRGAGALRDALARLEGVALPWGELEGRILPARVADYHPRMLDELGALGELVWVGAGALGPRNGRVALYRRDRAAALITPADLDALATTPVHRAILDHLRRAGASFLVAIEDAVAAAGATGDGSVREALWDLIWAGAITNDTFAPLRSFALGGAQGPRRTGGRGLRSRASASASNAFGGRWSLVGELILRAPAATARAHALAVTMLERWGVVSRDAATADGLPGGFGAIADVMRAMEDAGTVRRGYFVDGLAGAQYAWPGAIDALRAPAASGAAAPVVDVLSAVDPASVWGAVVPWPQLADPAARPARRAGASVIQADGQLVAFVETRGKAIVTASGIPDDVMVHGLVDGLARLAAATRRRELPIEHIDGGRAADSPWASALIAAGARVDYRGLVVLAGAPTTRALVAATRHPSSETDPDTDSETDSDTDTDSETETETETETDTDTETDTGSDADSSLLPEDA
jgi:ATP-dependent Lhr-like helicase